MYKKLDHQQSNKNCSYFVERKNESYYKICDFSSAKRIMYSICNIFFSLLAKRFSKTESEKSLRGRNHSRKRQI